MLNNNINKNNKEISNSNNIYSISKNYSKSLKINPIEIENNNSSKGVILRNAGKDLFDSKRYLTSEQNSIISLRHKGIKKKGHPLYDPYLIQACKNAIIREKNELPNYKEIIQKINTEYGIEEQKINENDIFNNNNSSEIINNNLQNNFSSFNNSSIALKDINNSAMSTNIVEKR
jgi:hypothetical protein